MDDLALGRALIEVLEGRSGVVDHVAEVVEVEEVGGVLRRRVEVHQEVEAERVVEADAVGEADGAVAGVGEEAAMVVALHAGLGADQGATFDGGFAHPRHELVILVEV